MWPFKKKKIEDELSITGLFPSLKPKKRRDVTLNVGLGIGEAAALWLGLGTYSVSTGTSVIVAGTLGAYVASAINIVLAVAASMVISALTTKKPSSGSVTSNGRQFNTKSTDEPLHLIYGEAKVGMNWVYCEESFKKNRHLNIAGTWGEGELEGYGVAIDIQADYSIGAGQPEGLNDLRIGGVYTGTSNIYYIKIDSAPFYLWIAETGYVVNNTIITSEPNGFYLKCTIGGTSGTVEPICPSTPGQTVVDGGVTWTCMDPVAEDIHDTFKWSKNDGIDWDATGVEIQADTWQTLGALGVKVKFHFQFGHTLNANWRFFAGDGFWLGEKLADYYKAYKATPSSGAKDLVLFNTFHSGTATQAVDTDLSAARPDWNDALRFTAWQYLKLLWNDYAWNSIPEAKGLLKGLKCYDPRDPATLVTPIYHQNTALAALDFLRKERYGFGIPLTELDENSFSEATTWYEGNGFTFNGAITSRQEFTENLNDILVNGRAFIAPPANGKLRYKIFADDAAIMSVTDDDFSLEEGVKIHQPGIPETPTKVKCIFIDKNKNYSTNFAEYPDTSTLVDDDERLSEIILIGTDTFLQAKRLAKYYYLRAKFGKTFSMLGRPRLFNLEPGDMITLTSEFLGFSKVKVRVFSIGLPSGGLIPLVLQEEDSSIYDLTVNTTEAEPSWVSSPADKTADMPTGLAMVSTALDTSTANLTDALAILHWDWIADGVDFIYRYKKVGDTGWKEDTKHDDPTEELMTLDIAPGTPWVTGETITGATSNKTCKIVEYLTTTTYTVRNRSGTFTLGEVLSHGAHTADQGPSYPTFGPLTVVSVTIKGLASSVEYEWQVRSRQGKSLSEWADGTNFVAYDPNPPTMTGVVLTPTSAAGGISLSWTPTTDRVIEVDKYCIYRALTDVYPGDANFYATQPRTSNQFQDVNVVPSTKYYYWINIYNKSSKYAVTPYGSVASAAEAAAAQGWTQTCAFSVTDADTVAWAAGQLILAAGNGTSTIYNVGANNTGNMTVRSFIYLDSANSTTEYQVTTVAANAVGANKTLVATAINGTVEPTFEVFGGVGGINIPGNNIIPGTITANEIANVTITANQIANATITTTQISATAGITGGQIANATITANDIANATITANQISSATITANEIANTTITAGKIANATITTTQISGTAGIIGGQIANATITANNMGNGSINANSIANSSINANHIGTGVITSNHIANGTINANDIGNAVINANHVGTGVINADHIANGTITANEMGNGSINANAIANLSINANHIGNNVITANQIANATITATQISGTAGITGGQIANATITANQIANGSINANHIVNGTITANDIGNAVITANQIANGTVTANQIANGTITAAQIGNGTITANQIANGAITSIQIANATITANDIANATITAVQIAAATITANEIANNTITAALLANLTITANQIANATITSTQIGNSTITGNNIANTTIIATNIGLGEITTSQISNTAGITGTQIANATITGNNITNQTITANDIALGAITGSLIANTTITANNIANQTITAVNIGNGIITGALIANTTIGGDNLILNTITANQIANATITTTQISGTAGITGNQIGNATIVANNLANGSVTANQIGNLAVTTAKIDNLAVTSAQIANATITANQISGTANITGNQIANATITANQIANNTITANQIANLAITANEIANATITTTQISGTAGITGAQIANATITANNLALAIITANQIANLTITANQIANATITANQIGSVTVDKLAAGSITSKAITLALSGGTGDVKIQAGKTDFGDTTSGFILGIDDSDGDKPKFEIGDANYYLKWNGTDVQVRTKMYNDQGGLIGSNLGLVMPGQHVNLVMVTAYTGYTTVITCDKAALLDSSGNAFLVNSLSCTGDIRTESGINGLDTGSRATATWYYIWLVSNGTTHGMLYSTTYTSGGPSTSRFAWTYALLVGAVTTFTTPNTYFWGQRQKGKHVVNMAISYRQFDADVGSWTTLNWPAANNEVPIGIKRAGIFAEIAKSSSGQATIFFAQDSSGYYRYGCLSTGDYDLVTEGSTLINVGFIFLPIEDDSVYFQVQMTTASTRLRILGWLYI